MKQWIVSGLGVLIVAVAGWFLYAHFYTPAFPINPQDSIASWTFKGAYTGNGTLVAQATADIEHLETLLGTGEYDDYDLYIGIGNDNNLLGNGKAAYDSYNRAAAIHTNKGLAYANIAHLMEELGAFYTAADAYERAVAAESRQLGYHLERLSYLTRQFPTDSARLLDAFTDASTEFGDTTQTLSIEAEWLTGLGRYADAITAWERAKLISPRADTSAIDAEIARLKAKQ
jgi:tetratricopeptide (TPR) repeat protein